MKNAYIITNSEMTAILKEHLAKQGFSTSKLSVRFTSTNAVVAGIEKVTHPGTGIYLATSTPSSDVEDQFDDEVEEDEDDFSLVEAVREELSIKPMTIAALTVALAVEAYQIGDALSDLDVEAVAPARENGQTVSKWMVTGTEAYEQFVAEEKARIVERTEELSSSILSSVPKFHERGVERPDLVNKVCEGLALEDEREALRRDARAVFYRMAELGQLEHHNHSWRAGKTEADRINVASLQGAVREVLMSSVYGMSRQELSEKLPGFVDDSLLRHAIKRMDDVYEQDGLLRAAHAVHHTK
jgi:hypothetical protein